MTYIPLRIVTHYSVLKSIIQPKELITFAKENFDTIAVTDINNLFAGAEFSFATRQYKYPAVLGCSVHTSQGIITLYCKNEYGYKTLCRLISDNNMLYNNILPFAKIAEYKDDLVCITGNVDGVLKQNMQHNIKLLIEIFGENFFLELNRTNGKAHNENEISDLSQKYNIPVVGTSVAYFIKPEHAAAYQAVQAIEANEVIIDDNKFDSNTGRLLTNEEMYEKFKDCPVVLENTIALAKKCTFLLSPQKPRFASFAQDESSLLRQWSQEGLEAKFKDPSWFALIEDRYESIEQAKILYQERLDYELEMIIKLGFAGYFLIVADFVSWAREQKISLSARGSGAGSLVALALKIIVIDPIYFGLFFERFINPGRVSLPDFDIDFCQERRGEVIDYVTQKYTKDFVAHIITFGMWHSRGVLRDIGRILNIPYKVVDHLCKLIPNKPNFSLTLSEALEFDQNLKQQYDTDSKIRKLFDISMLLEGNNRNIGTHAAGVVIGYDKLKNLIPLYWTEGMQLPATGYTMKYIEQASLVKFDFLGLTALTIIDKVTSMIDQQIDIQNIDIKDQRIFELLCHGLTAGIFQFESMGLTNTIKKLQPTTLDELTAIISLYRPGPMENIDTYISNKRNPEQIEYTFEELSGILEETFGIIIYQEQVISIAKILADYTLSEADILRRAMGKKNPQEMSEQRTKFTLNIVNKILQKHFGITVPIAALIECIDEDKLSQGKVAKYLLKNSDIIENAKSDIVSDKSITSNEANEQETEQDNVGSIKTRGKKKNKSKNEDLEQLIEQMSELMHDTHEKATDLFDQIVKFSGYAFNKAHAVSHAFIGYQTAYLKTYYKLEFMAISMTMEQDKHEKVAMLNKELALLDIELLKPNVNRSTTVFEVKYPNQILYSLACVKSIGALLVEDIMKERIKAAYTSVENLCSRVRLSSTTMDAMIFSGALDLIPIHDMDAITDIVTHRSAIYHQREVLMSAQGVGIFTLTHTGANFSVNHILLMEYKYLGIVLSIYLLKTIIQPKAEVILSTEIERHKFKYDKQKQSEVYVSGLLLDKQMIKTKKNTVQYILMLADTASTFEVFVDSELYEAAQVAVGDIIICQITARNQYITCNKLFPQIHTIRNVQICIYKHEELGIAKSFTDSLIPGATKVLLKIYGNSTKVLSLNSHHITNKHLSQLDELKLQYETNVEE